MRSRNTDEVVIDEVEKIEKCRNTTHLLHQCLGYEKLCEMDQAPYNYKIYRCQDQKTCILYDWVEDGQADCPAHDDERAF